VGSRSLRYGACLVLAVVMISACSGTTVVTLDERPTTPKLTTPSVITNLPASITARGRRDWTNMHADHRPRGPITFGRGDVDGDGYPNMVIVDYSSHIAMAKVRGRYLWVRIPADASTRLQSVPDLSGDGRHEILVGRSTAACCDYRLVDSRALVLGYLDGRLALLRHPDGRAFELLFSVGRRDVFAGVRCQGQRLSQRTVTASVRHRLKVTTIQYQVIGTVVRQEDRATSVEHGSKRHAAALSRSACPGMTRYGWAR
jgi:hypothetical protein